MNAVEKSMDKAIEKSFGKDGNKKDYKDNLKKEIAKDVKVFAVTEKFKSATKTFACGVKSQADKLKTTILNRMRGNQK
ncbi:MAG: hypothetical protein BWY78_00976 [Alphaproteobacteria bacterium ADurb.Bin438]|nr:MAG: hypothetical protein BWY78_00976 [Alphaproteobacteria bacterium ADurb.Bin438]